MTDTVLMVFCTAPTSEVAQKIAAVLVEKRLAACVSMIGNFESIYRWEGKIEHTKEISLQIKTKAAAWPLLLETLQSIHPYDVPEILAIPVKDGLPAYLEWVCHETQV